MAAEPATRSLVVATYNVHEFVGRDGAYDPERVARVVEELDADVLALQEVSWARGPDDPLARLAARTAMHPILGPTLVRGEASYGNALLTRLPADRVRRLDLSVDGREPRGALDCVLRVGPTPLRVIATHLGLRARERRRQVARLALELERPGPPTLLLLGDLNDWRSRIGPMAPLRRFFGRHPQPRSFPAWRPALALDRILVRPQALLHRTRAHHSPLAAVASDHLPVCAELQPKAVGRGL